MRLGLVALIGVFVAGGPAAAQDVASVAGLWRFEHQGIVLRLHDCGDGSLCGTHAGWQPEVPTGLSEACNTVAFEGYRWRGDHWGGGSLSLPPQAYGGVSIAPVGSSPVPSAWRPGTPVERLVVVGRSAGNPMMRRVIMFHSTMVRTDDPGPGCSAGPVS